jgi:trk system potassium uptake protein TrkA
MGVKEILVKAINEDHAEALQNVGATIAVFPERDIARKIADSLLTPNLIDFIPVSEGHSIVEMTPPSQCIGKTLAELRLRNRFSLQVLAVKTPADAEEVEIGKITPDAIVVPDGTFRVERHHVLIIMGENKNIEKFRKLS